MNVYEHLMDDQSRYYYDKRMEFYKTGDYGHLLEMIKELPETKTWDKYVELCRDMGDKLIVYGACADAEIFIQLYPDVDCFCFCDRDERKQATGWFGKDVISPDELFEKYSDYPILINASDYHKEIYDFLIENGIPEENIYNKGKEIAENYPMQYFDDEIMTPVDDEIFIDGGCFDLNTARRFATWCGGNYKKIYSFEPDEYSYGKCVEYNKANPIARLELLNKGTSDKTETLKFVMAGEGGHITSDEQLAEEKKAIIEAGEEYVEPQVVEINVDSIDNVVGDDKVTFIKLDVEGAELAALHGAEKTIKNNKPRLAISIYHKPEDIVEIPEYILSLNPDYKFYIRHYKFSYYETVLYAI